MVIEEMTEWRRLGARLRELCPEKFDEIMEALRETVAAHDILRSRPLILAAQRPKT